MRKVWILFTSEELRALKDCLEKLNQLPTSEEAKLLVEEIQKILF